MYRQKEGLGFNVTTMSDEDRISPYNINTVSRRQAVRIKNYIN